MFAFAARSSSTSACGIERRASRTLVAYGRSSPVAFGQTLGPLRRAWLRHAPTGGTRPAGRPQQAARGSRWPSRRMPAVLTRHPVPDPAELPLSRRGRAQGQRLSRPARGHRRCRAMERRPGKAGRQPQGARVGCGCQGTEPAVRPHLRWRRQSHDADARQQERQTVPILHLGVTARSWKAGSGHDARAGQRGVWSDATLGAVADG